MQLIDGIKCIVAAIGLSGPAAAQQNGATDKSQFTLFNPVPVGLMRELSADRPDGTESPYTVDAGHFQAEVSIADYAHDDEGGTQSDILTWAESNMKLGLTNNTDLQLVFTPYAREAVDLAGGPEEVLEGAPDLTVRLKANLWGNDGGETAFAVMPFVTLPTGSELSGDHVEGGLIAMLGWNVAATWSLGFQAEVDTVYDDEDDDYDAEFVHTAVLGFDVYEPLGAYVEYIGNAGSEGEYAAVFSTGATYTMNANLVLDAGTRVGLNDAAEDLVLFSGFTWRY